MATLPCPSERAVVSAAHHYLSVSTACNVSQTPWKLLPSNSQVFQFGCENGALRGGKHSSPTYLLPWSFFSEFGSLAGISSWRNLFLLQCKHAALWYSLSHHEKGELFFPFSKLIKHRYKRAYIWFQSQSVWLVGPMSSKEMVWAAELCWQREKGNECVRIQQ